MKKIFISDNNLYQHHKKKSTQKGIFYPFLVLFGFFSGPRNPQFGQNLCEISEKNEYRIFLRGAKISAGPGALFGNTDQTIFYCPNLFFSFQRRISNNAGRAQKLCGFLKGHYVLLWVQNFLPEISACLRN